MASTSGRRQFQSRMVSEILLFSMKFIDSMSLPLQQQKILQATKVHDLTIYSIFIIHCKHILK